MNEVILGKQNKVINRLFNRVNVIFMGVQL